MEQFIREKIKDKPLNKKRLAKKAGTAALCGVAFAVAASIVFAIFLPVINRQSKKASDGKNNNDVQIATQQPGIDDSNDAYSENGTQSTESGTSSEPSLQTYQPTLADYQAVQNQLYSVGASASKFVVGVTGVTDATDIFNNSYETEGQGVGVILRDNGKQLIILTEKNVVDKADKLSVTFVNDMMADAALVKYDSNTGIAIISVDKSLLDDATTGAIAVAELGNSNIVSRGASVIALEANYAILTGLVTSTTNELSAQDNNYSVLTTDIASNKLQSGILINTDGQVIGLSLQDFNPAEENNTLTAVSISDLSPVIEKLESGADVPYTGITCTTVTEKIANRYNIPKGVYIKQVTMDSPAFVSGLQSGDVIVAVNNTDVSNVSAYNKQLMQQKPEDTCNLKVKRKGSNGYTEITCQVKIGVMN